MELTARRSDLFQNRMEVAPDLRVCRKHTNGLLKVNGTDLLELAPDGDASRGGPGRHAIDKDGETIATGLHQR